MPAQLLLMILLFGATFGSMYVGRIELTVLQILVASVIGIVASSLITRLWWVMIIAAIVTVSDVVSVFSQHGLTQHLAHNPHSIAVSFLAVLIPAPGNPSGSILGMADLVFIAIFISLGNRFGLPARRTSLALLCSLLFTGIVGLMIGRTIPALPGLALAFACVHGRIMTSTLRWELDSASAPRLHHD